MVHQSDYTVPTAHLPGQAGGELGEPDESLSMKAVIRLTVLALLLSLPEVAAGTPKPQKRTERARYLAPMAGYYTPTPVGVGGACDSESQIGCVLFETYATERFVRVSVSDDVGESVAAVIWQDQPGDDVGEGYAPVAELCGRTTAWKVLPWPGRDVEIAVYNGACEDGRQSIATQGEVRVTLTDRA